MHSQNNKIAWNFLKNQLKFIIRAEIVEFCGNMENQCKEIVFQISKLTEND